jgi:hypothetical protein
MVSLSVRFRLQGLIGKAISRCFAKMVIEAEAQERMTNVEEEGREVKRKEEGEEAEKKK